MFLGFARQVYDLGAFGNGSKMKLVANQLVAIHNVAAAEAMVLGMKAGLDPHQIVEVIGSGAGTSRMFELRAPMMADNPYQPATMRSTTWKKDMTVIGEFASDLGCPMPLFSLADPMYEAVCHGARRRGHRRRVCGAGGDGGPEALAVRSGSRPSDSSAREHRGPSPWICRAHVMPFGPTGMRALIPRMTAVYRAPR